MPYTVIWDESAQDELARIWNQGPDRQDVSDAANEIDHELGLNPLGVGDAWEDGRSLTIHPLQVYYTVSPDDRWVKVHFVWRV